MGHRYNMVKWFATRIGTREGSEEHKRIIDVYNTLRPLPRGYMMRYLSLFGDFDPLLFGLGTFFTFLKEVVRIAVLDRRPQAFPPLVKGWADSRKIMKDRSWKPARAMQKKSLEKS